MGAEVGVEGGTVGAGLDGRAKSWRAETGRAETVEVCRVGARVTGATVGLGWKQPAATASRLPVMAVAIISWSG